jgi:hypothetical protein
MIRAVFRTGGFYQYGCGKYGLDDGNGLLNCGSSVALEASQKYQ